MNAPHKINHKAVAAATPSLRMEEGADIKKWQKKARKKLMDLLGLPFEKCEENFNLEYTKRRANFTEYRFTFQSEEGYTVPCHLWKPKKRGKLATMICLQGHSKGMHISMGRPKYPGDEVTAFSGDRDFANQCIREGVCALVIEQRNFGECGSKEDGNPNCYESSMAALLTGRTTIGERVWDVSRAIDATLGHFRFVDKKRIYCMGNSGGGTATIYAAAIDTRIAAAMPSCALCTYRDSIAAMYHCACNYVPNIANFFDMGDLLGLVAPRPVSVVAGAEDKIFPLTGVKESVEVAKTYYDAANAPDRIALSVGPEGHRFYADIGWKAFNEVIEK